MKKLDLIVGFCLSFFSNIAFCAANDSAVVFFTLLHNREGVSDALAKVGNTQRLAIEIASTTKATTVFELNTVNKYPASYDAIVNLAQEEQANNTVVPLESVPDISDFQTIYLGFPNWWGSYPQAVATFIDNNDFSNKTVYVFVTHEGSRFGRSIHDLKEKLPTAQIIPLLHMRGEDTKDVNKVKGPVSEALNNIK